MRAHLRDGENSGDDVGSHFEDLVMRGLMLSEGPVVVSVVDVFVCVLDWVDWLIDEVIEEDE